MTAITTLSGATAVVTGAGAGIGRATALALAAEGAHVHVTDVEGARAEKVAAEVEGQGGTATAHRLDVTGHDAVVVFEVGAQDDSHGDIGLCERHLGPPPQTQRSQPVR